MAARLGSALLLAAMLGASGCSAVSGAANVATGTARVAVGAAQIATAVVPGI